MAKIRTLKKIQSPRLIAIRKKKRELIRLTRKLSKQCNINILISFSHQNREKSYIYSSSSNMDLESLKEEINNAMNDPNNTVYTLQDYDSLFNTNQHQDELSTQEDESD